MKYFLVLQVFKYQVIEIPFGTSSISSTKCLKYLLVLQVFEYFKYQVLEILLGTSSIQVFQVTSTWNAFWYFKYSSISCTKKLQVSKYFMYQKAFKVLGTWNTWSTKKYIFKYLKYEVFEILFATSSIQVFKVPSAWNTFWYFKCSSILSAKYLKYLLVLQVFQVSSTSNTYWYFRYSSISSTKYLKYFFVLQVFKYFFEYFKIINTKLCY